MKAAYDYVGQGGRGSGDVTAALYHEMCMTLEERAPPLCPLSDFYPGLCAGLYQAGDVPGLVLSSRAGREIGWTPPERQRYAPSSSSAVSPVEGWNAGNRLHLPGARTTPGPRAGYPQTEQRLFFPKGTTISRWEERLRMYGRSAPPFKRCVSYANVRRRRVMSPASAEDESAFLPLFLCCLSWRHGGGQRPLRTLLTGKVQSLGQAGPIPIARDLSTTPPPSISTISPHYVEYTGEHLCGATAVLLRPLPGAAEGLAIPFGYGCSYNQLCSGDGARRGGNGQIRRPYRRVTNTGKTVRGKEVCVSARLTTPPAGLLKSQSVSGGLQKTQAC